MQGDSDVDDDEMPSMLESLPEVASERASFKETEHASAGSFFIGVNGGVVWCEEGLDVGDSPEEPFVSKREGDESGVSNGVSTLLGLLPSFS